MKLFYSGKTPDHISGGLETAVFTDSFQNPVFPAPSVSGTGCMVIGGRIPAEPVSALLTEIQRRGIRTVCTGFEPSPCAHVEALCRALRERHIRCILAEPCWNPQLSCGKLISGLISGGRWQSYLDEKTAEGAPLAIDFQRMRHLFSLPCPSGQGQPLSSKQAAALIRKHSGSFFSQSLMCNVLPCIDSSECSFLLWDDRETLCRKVKTAAGYGVEWGFLLDGEWCLEEAQAAAEQVRENPAIQG